jgi:hypothetical protein
VPSSSSLHYRHHTTTVQQQQLWLIDAFTILPLLMTTAMELPIALDDSMPLNVKSHVRVTTLDVAPITMLLSHFAVDEASMETSHLKDETIRNNNKAKNPCRFPVTKQPPEFIQQWPTRPWPCRSNKTACCQVYRPINAVAAGLTPRAARCV